MTTGITCRAAAGLLARRQRWGLTRRGWLVLLLIVFAAGAFLVLDVYPFLGLSSPVASRVMVVEGWISEESLRIAAERFLADHYEMICTTGGAYPDRSRTGAESAAAATANQFYELGIPRDRVTIIPFGEPRRDRTYTGAVAVRNWFKEKGIPLTSLNVVTQGVHARRSRLMFEEAFGDGVRVGVISIRPREYDPDRWWRYSEGVKEVVSESAAYLYAKFLFRPEE